MKERKGFTLIELLVVIAIIAILAAILFPVFTAAKNKAQQSACLNNMKQISTGLYSYLSDYNDTFPPNRLRDPYMSANSVLNGSRFNWKTAVYNYIKNKNGAWRCPSNVNSDSLDETASNSSIPPAVRDASTRFPISYAYNGDYFNDFQNTDPPRPVKLSEITRPTRLILICESVMETPDIHSDFAEQRWASYTDISSNKPVNGCRIVLHSGKVSNFIFADTHAKASRLKNVFTPQTMWHTNPGLQYYYNDVANKLASDAL